MFYRGAYDLLKPHKPLAKFMLVKAVIFLTFLARSFYRVSRRDWKRREFEEGRATRIIWCAWRWYFSSIFIQAFPYYVYANRSGVSRFVANVGHALSVGMFWTIPCISLEGRIRNTRCTERTIIAAAQAKGNR